MKILKWILIVVVLVALLVIGFMNYMGLFCPVNPYEVKMGPYMIAYESFVGPYAKTGPVFARVNDALKAEGIVATRGLGIYYDNPSQVPAEKLRSDCGVVIEQKDLVQFNKLKAKFKVKEIAKSDSVVVEFPIRNALSYMFGPMKAYPVLTKYAGEKNYKVTMSYELYDEAHGKAFFVMVIEKNQP
jgi:hypothetical protein